MGMTKYRGQDIGAAPVRPGRHLIAHSASHGTAHRVLKDVEALDAIQQALSTMEWSADTADHIASLVRLTGREVS
jgi:hypothetical protein